MLSRKQSQLLSRSIDLASTSDMAQKHSSALLMGGKVVAMGVNNNRNCYKTGTLSSTPNAVFFKVLYFTRATGKRAINAAQELSMSFEFLMENWPVVVPVIIVLI